MLKKNLSTLFALSLVILAVPAFAGGILGDYEDSYAEGESTLSISSYDVDTEFYGTALYEAPAEGSASAVSVAPIQGVDCQDTDEVSVAHFPAND